MFVAVDRPITGDLLQQMSDGALKLLMAVRTEPNAAQARYIELVGKCERSVRNFGRELLALGLVQRVKAQAGVSRSQQRRAHDQQSPSARMVEDTAAEMTDGPASDPWLVNLKDDQRDCYLLLRHRNVEPSGAHDLAQRCDRAMIVAAIEYTDRHHPTNTAAYLVWCLKSPSLWYMPSVDQPVTAASDAEWGDISDSKAPGVPSVLSDDEPVVSSAPIVSELRGTDLVQPDFDTLLLAYAVEAATGVDVRLNREGRETVEQLNKVGYSAEDVAVFADQIFPQDWRGKRGERPTLQALREGIAAARYQLQATIPKTEGLLYRVQAIRRYSPMEIGPLVHLSDLWSDQVRAALVTEARMRDYCPTCERPWSMCRCVETPLCTDPRAQWWSAMIGQLKVQLDKPTFETWVAPLRLIGFEPSEAGDTFIAECIHEYQCDWLAANLLSTMVEMLTKLHYHLRSIDPMSKQVKIELSLIPN